MNLSEEQLSVVEEMAGLFFDPVVIGKNIGLKSDEIENFSAGVELGIIEVPLLEAYFKGRLTADILLRKAIKQAAQNGSSPAQQIMLNFFRESKV